MTDALHNIAPPGSLAALDLEHLLHPVTPLKAHHEKGPQFRARGQGVYVYDEHGKQYLEGLAGLWCTALGYGEEELISAASETMRNLSYAQLFGSVSHEPAIRLAEKLKSMMPFNAGRVFFGLSGSDANDTQIKLMWYYHNLIGKPEKKKIIAREGGYHGTTLASGSLTGLPPFHKHFDLPIPQVLRTDRPHYYRDHEDGESEAEFVDRIIGNLKALVRREGADTIAAFIAEPITGAGGLVVPPVGYFDKLKPVLDENDIFYIDDEVICGFGRTGKTFGIEHFPIEPTTMSVAKAMSSAYLPMSAVVIPEFMYEPMTTARDAPVFGHGFTYSGHPVCSAVALRTLEIYEEREIFAHAAKVGEVMQARLAALIEHPLVGNVRGKGLLGGVELMKDGEQRIPFDAHQTAGARVVQRAYERGLILRPLGDTIGICPPLVISEHQVHELFDKLAAALDDSLDLLG